MSAAADRRPRIAHDAPSTGPASGKAASNALEFTVGELSGALKATIEDRFGFVRVRGEISNYRGPHASGHAYFCLKDDAARIDAVIWRTALQRLKVKPQDGLEVVATGRVTTFPGKSTYQIVVETIEPAGVGALMALVEARRRSLAAEGLFDEARKRPLPFLPVTIGVVTSPTGAVIRDILHRLADRFPRRVLVWPVRVQGDTAASEVAAAIAGFNALSPHGAIPRPDVVIVARGGGSLEDLWAFNEEVVVRAAAESAIPLISAVGHETDWTLIDHAADLRAPTPSGAAEKVVPVRRDLLARVSDGGRRHAAAIARRVERGRAELRALARAMPAAEAVIGVPRQRLDRAEGRLGAAVTASRDARHLAVARLAQRLSQQAPRVKLAESRKRLAGLQQSLEYLVARARDGRVVAMRHTSQRLAGAALGIGRDVAAAHERLGRGSGALTRVWTAGAARRRDRVERLSRLLDTLGYRNVLSRGFALVRDGSGRPVRAVAAIDANAVLDIELADGHIDALATPRRAPPRKPRPNAEQGSLF